MHLIVDDVEGVRHIILILLGKVPIARARRPAQQPKIGKILHTRKARAAAIQTVLFC